jgi:creatinine amidohydrolase/Fe(II)-dependent formamide hydrolase-like protein
MKVNAGPERSMESHGPHLLLSTDTMIAEAIALRGFSSHISLYSFIVIASYLFPHWNYKLHINR